MQFLHTRRPEVQKTALLPVLLLVFFCLAGPVQASSFLVTWNPPSETPPDSIDYYVYVSTDSDSFDEQDRILVEDGESVVVDVPCETGTTYYFAVQSVDNLGQTSSLVSPKQPLLATGPGPGWSNSDTAHLFAFDDRGSELLDFAAYNNVGQTRGLRLACGDVLGLGKDQIVTAPGPGSHGPEIRVFHADGTPVDNGSFLAFQYSAVGATVCCGDLDGDGKDEIVVGAGPGHSFQPGVKVFSFSNDSFNTSDLSGFLAFPGGQGYGVNVACGDLDGDGCDEIITGCGPGPALRARIRVFTKMGDSIKPVSGLDFMAYDAVTRGVNVACGDVDGDGYDEIITGPGPALNCCSDVRIFDVDGNTAVTAGPTFRAFPMPHFGVNVAAADVDNDCFEEVLTAPGPSPNYPGVIRWFSLATGRAEFRGQIKAQAGTTDNTFGANLAVGRLNL
jgi:hypothetical protein